MTAFLSRYKKNYKSEHRNVDRGVPHGSILGLVYKTLLSFMYVKHVWQTSIIHMYASLWALIRWIAMKIANRIWNVLKENVTFPSYPQAAYSCSSNLSFLYVFQIKGIYRSSLTCFVKSIYVYLNMYLYIPYSGISSHLAHLHLSF